MLRWLYYIAQDAWVEESKGENMKELPNCHVANNWIWVKHWNDDDTYHKGCEHVYHERWCPIDNKHRAHAKDDYIIALLQLNEYVWCNREYGKGHAS